MGFEDIIYDLIKEYRAARADKQKQTEIAKSLTKKAYLRFNFEWNTEKNTDIGLDTFLRIKHELFMHYSQVFLDIAVEIYDILPEESERLKNMAKAMKAGALDRHTRAIISIGDKIAESVMQYYQNLNQ